MIRLSLSRILLSIFALLILLVMSTPARADGLIVVRNPPAPVPGHFTFAPLEVTYHQVTCDINDQVAVTSVDQEFYNPNNARLEGDYIFPVPLNAQIDKFAMDIDGKIVEAELLPADKARGIYEEIVRKAKDPALLEYAGRAMYKVRIFPIEPNSKKRIQLKYTELLKQESGLLDYHYTLNTEKFSSKPLKNVSIKVTVNTTEPITTLYSPTHEVEIKRTGDTKAVVGYEAKDIRPDTDFHLFIGRKATAVGISLLTYRPDPDKDGYFVLLAAPTLSKNTKSLPKDVVFIMDTSGSMSGAKIEQTRKALRYCIETLNPEDRFDIVRFSTEAEPLFGNLVTAGEPKKDQDESKRSDRGKALQFADNLKAAGGTAIQDALVKALDERPAKDDGRLFLVVFMTDGQPTIGEQNPDKILSAFKDKAGTGGSVRVFTFGVGTDVNTKLLDLLAEQSRGYSQYVLPNENLELAMSNFWGKVQDPVLAGLKLDSGSVTLAKLYPKDMPDLFKGDQLIAFGTYSKPGKTAITLTGMVNGKAEKFAQDVTFDEKTDTSHDWIGKLWATRRVGYILDEIRLHGESKELKDEVTELARRWGIVTPYTAMLIIEDEKARGVPVATRSLREMEGDHRALKDSENDYDSLRRREAVGGKAVANSISGDKYKNATSLDQTVAAAEQLDGRFIAQGTGGSVGQGASGPGRGQPSDLGMPLPTLRKSGKADDTPATNAPTAATTAAEKALNLGSQTATGWQTAQDGTKTKEAGYRVVSNYAQQSRMVNNRAFYLNGNQWTDGNVQKLEKAARIKIVFNSDAYFDLLKKFPESSQYLSLGNNVTVELGGTIYDIIEEEPAPAPAK